MSSRKITLTTEDKDTFEVGEAVAMQLGMVRSFLEQTDSADDVAMPLPNVRSGPLKSIIEYCEKQVDLDLKAQSDSESERAAAESERKEYDVQFLKGVTNEEAREMIVAANYLDVRGLLELLVQAIADRIKNRSVEYVRAFFGIENDYTPEEEAKMKEEHAWSFEGLDPDD